MGPIPCMGLEYFYLPVHKGLICMINFGKYTIHGCYGDLFGSVFVCCFSGCFCCRQEKLIST